MNADKSKRNWLWFGATMSVVLALGVTLRFTQRVEPSGSLIYDIEKYRTVNPKLIAYTETGSINPTLKQIRAICIDRNDRIYVSGANGVQIFNANGEIHGQFSVNGVPDCLSVGRDGKIYVGMRDNIEVYNIDGEMVDVWESLGGNAWLTSLAVTTDIVYAADAGTRVVWGFNRKGKPVIRIDGTGIDGLGDVFVVPSPYFDIAVTDENSIWVVNPGLHALEKYRSNGALITSWERSSFQIDGFCGCCNPSHIALMPNGSFVTSEKGLPRVKIHGPTGELLCVVAGPEQFDAKVTGLDLAVDSNGRILVLDTAMNKIRIFERIEKRELK